MIFSKKTVNAQSDRFSTLAETNALARIKLALCSLVLCMPFYSTAVEAADIPGFTQKVELSVREMPVPRFIKTIFGEIGVPVEMDKSVVGQVNGGFKGPANEIFNDVIEKFNVAVYYDNSVAHVYKKDDIKQKMLPLSSKYAKKLMGRINKLGLEDTNNTVTMISGEGVKVSGSKRFVRQVNEQYLNIRPARKREKNKIVLRKFDLTYAWAADTVQSFGSDEIVIRGVAAKLREMMAISGQSEEIITRRKKSQASSADDDGKSGADDADLVRKSVTTGNWNTAGIVAHPDTNSVWVRDYADKMDFYQLMIDELDVEPQMVEIEATIIDLFNNKQRDLGINWRINKDGSDILFNDGAGIGNLGLPQQLNPPAGTGGIVNLVFGDTTRFITHMRALEELGAAKIVSKPHIVTMSNVKAELRSTSELHIRLEGREAVSLETIEIENIFQVIPRVFEKDKRGVNLLYSIEDSVAQGELDRIPGIDRNQIQSRAIVYEGQSLLIGGMTRERSEKSTSKVPLLGDIPILGGIFKSKKNISTQSERLYLITPKISNGSQFDHGGTGPVLQGTVEEIVSTSMQRRDSSFDNPAKPSLPEEPVIATAPKADPEPMAAEPAIVETVTPAVEIQAAKPAIRKPSTDLTALLFVPDESSISNDLVTADSPLIAVSTQTDSSGNDGWAAIKQ